MQCIERYVSLTEREYVPIKALVISRIQIRSVLVEAGWIVSCSSCSACSKDRKIVVHKHSEFAG